LRRGSSELRPTGPGPCGESVPMRGYFYDYDPFIVCLSVVASILAVYVALDLTGRVAASQGAARFAWILAGALVTGVGMWTMHFTGMLALRLPVTVTYTVKGALSALVIAVAASMVWLLVAATREAMSLWALLAASVLGIGMGAMHVVAMRAMRLAATPVFETPMIFLSVVIAITASVALVSLASRLRSDETSGTRRRRLVASLVIGLCVASMHYTAMAGTTFRPVAAGRASESAQLLATHVLAYAVITGCVLMVVLALASAAVGRALERRARVATEHARLQAEAEHARDAAQAANRAKSAFLAAMSHELRTPLNSIAGYTQILQLGVHGQLTAQQLDDLARIERSEKHLLALINDVLTFTSLEAGGVAINPQRVSADSLMSTVEAMITPQMQSHGLRFMRHRARDALTLYCDPEKAEQVLLNLLSNAVKFTPRGGTIELQSCAVDGVGRISVRDSGAGIPKEKLEAIFEPFVQVERTLTSVTEGAGLGLAISRNLARAMGGDLRVWSKVGKGSVFTFEIPLAANFVAADA
jgi:signal transduction histidine kinase